MEDKYFGFVYETTNLINNKKYIGKCIFKRQNNWESYLGSGIYLKSAVKKYGKENFHREILFLALDEEELNQLEEEVIGLMNAVESSEYYNLKKTAIGGDIFTTHPQKELIRGMRKKQMSGKGNHQYGKAKTEKMLNSVKEANSKKIIVSGMIYDSITEFSKVSGINVTTVWFRLSSPYYDYRYADYPDKEIKGQENNPKAKISIIINGNVYESILEASKVLNISRRTIRSRLNDKDFPNFTFNLSNK